MYVLIPHPTEELKLIKYQKLLTSALFQEGFICYSSNDFWIPFLEDETEINTEYLKSVSKSITQITVNEPQIRENQIFCPVKICTDKEIDSEIFLGRIINEKKLQQENIKKSDLFPLNLKIFRLGVSVQISSNCKAIENSVWRKL